MSDQEEPVSESYTLFVGEGDFSFSANYIKTKACYEKVYASCLSDHSLTERQLKNIRTIRENGGFVFTDVDATQLEYHHEIKDLQFSKIIFNFPHIAGKMNIRKNRQLVQEFFLSSKKVLKVPGVVIVTLCQGQGGTDIEKVKRKWSDTWQVVSLAASASYILYKIQPFNSHEFDTYKCTGFRGLEKPFKTDKALTHMFTLCNPVCLKDTTAKSYLDTVLYLQNVEELYRCISWKPSHPCNKVSSILNDIADKLFYSTNQQTIYDLLSCSRFSSTNFDVECMDINFCKDCMSYLVSLFLLGKKSHCITSFKCTVCCIKNICLNSFPFCYLQAYFCDDINTLLSNLPMFLKYLKTKFNLNTCSELMTSDHLLHKTVQSVSQNYGTKHLSVKSILSLYATYSVYQGEEFFFYSDVDFFLMKNGNSSAIKSGVFKFGNLLQISDNINSYFCIIFDINILSCLKYHIMDYKVLLSESSFYTSQVLHCCSVDMYRSLSLYPPTFVHDISFYIDENFNEKDLFLVIRNAVGYLIKSVSLIDSYYNNVLKKYSRCYRFIYQSCDEVLSKSLADYIHTKFMRKVLENSLNISLR